MRGVLLVMIVAAACGGSPKPAPPPPPAAAPCVADGLGEVRVVTRLDTTCRDQQNCRASCERGDAMACMQDAYALQRAERYEDADPVFARACKLGLVIGCVNFGAALWLTDTKPQPACARRLFERACDAREPFGCGMLGRMRAADATTPAQQEEARRFFDRVCSDMGAMTCRMYAHHLEQGDLGDFDPATVKALMLRACNTGDDDACGKDSAEGTFY